jgi:hypothetical protein
MEADIPPTGFAACRSLPQLPKEPQSGRPLSSVPGRSLAFAWFDPRTHGSQPSRSSITLRQPNAQRPARDIRSYRVPYFGNLCLSARTPAYCRSPSVRDPRTVSRTFRCANRLPLTLGSLIGFPDWCGLGEPLRRYRVPRYTRTPSRSRAPHPQGTNPDPTTYVHPLAGLNHSRAERVGLA